MKSRFRFMPVAIGAACLMMSLLLAACGGQPASSSAASSSAGDASASATSASSEGASSATPASDAHEEVTLSLDYNAGTGYEWRCTSMDPEGVVELVGQSTDDLSKSQETAGGPLQDHFTFRATGPGEVALTFELKRFWDEGEEAAETQVYAFTVTDDLNLVLNPYKSDFANEPEWETGE